MQGSLLGRIARHGVSGLRDPREDRLTEICAALFAAPQCEGMALHVARGWLVAATEDVPGFAARTEALLDPERAWSCKVETQVRFDSEDGPRCPDLALWFTSP